MTAHRAASTGRTAGAFLGALALWATFLAPRASAQTRAIGPGHEGTVLALFAPHALGDQVAPGFALWGVSIDVDRVSVQLRGPEGRDVRVLLTHPADAPPDAPRVGSFAVQRTGATGADADAAFRALIGRLEHNDGGGFWQSTGSTPTWTGLRREGLWGSSDWVPLDGIAVFALIVGLALLLAWRSLHGHPRWMPIALAAIVAAGALVRLALAPVMLLGAWPWTRIYPHVRAVTEGAWLTHAGGPYFLNDVAQWTNFAYAAAMPLVLFGHATSMLRDPRAGLAAAFAIAALPQHIRFARCEDGFVASLVMTSLAFALIHGWLRDPSRRVRVLLLVALPLVLYPGYLLRPLNILFIVVYAVALLALHEQHATFARRALGLVVVVGVGAAALVAFFGRHERTVGAVVTQGELALSAVQVLLSPRLLVLSDPTRTPPALVALAVLGALLAWRAGERRLVAFLVGWLLLFEVAHAAVVQETMQPRYHLHLVVPFLLLASMGAVRLWDLGCAAIAQLEDVHEPGPTDALGRRLAAARPRAWVALAGASLLAAPWLHGDFIRTTDHAEHHEYRFLRRARDLVPEGCTVLEYAGDRNAPADLRFPRLGERAGRDAHARFRVVGVWSDGTTGPEADAPSLDALAADPPSCLYVYEGLTCSTDRGPDEAYASRCTSLRERFGTETAMQGSAPARIYDGALGRGRPLALDRLPLRLSRRRSGPSGPGHGEGQHGQGQHGRGP